MLKSRNNLQAGVSAKSFYQLLDRTSLLRNYRI